MSKAKPTVKPLHGYVLVEVEERKEKTAGGIIIPDGAKQGNLKFGRVISVGPKVPREGVDAHTQPAVGQLVFFDENVEQPIDIGSNRVLVPFPAIVAAQGGAESKKYPIPVTTFFKLPSWKDFIGTDFASWENYIDLTHFCVKVDFLEPFWDLGPLGRRVHECAVEALRGLSELDLSSIRYAKKDDDFLTVVSDDVWSGVFRVDTKNAFLEMQEQETSVRTLHKTLPRLLTGFRNALASADFLRIAGEDYSRVTSVVFRFHQRMKLQGRGARLQDVNNSELMQQFLLFGQKGTNPATLDALGVKPKDIGRIDMKVSFDKKIGDHDYRVFMNVQAPANEDHTVIDVEWEIQDHSPGHLPDRDYSPVYTTFFRDVVLRSFYKRWFQENDDIVCATSKR